MLLPNYQLNPDYRIILLMKKIGNVLTIVGLIVIFGLVTWFYRPETPSNKIIKIKSANEFYVDKNNDGIADDDELVEMYYVRAFVPNIETSETNFVDSSKLSWLAEEFVKKNLLNKQVELQLDNEGRLITVRAGSFDYSKALTEDGLGIINPSIKENPYKNHSEKIKESIQKADKLNLVSYNYRSKKYHTLDCKFAFKSSNIQILPLAELNKKGEKAEPCKACHNKNKKLPANEKYPRNVSEKYTTSYKDSYIELYLSDFTRFFFPAPRCVTTACQSLLREINNAKSTIDFAIYGISSQPTIEKALVKAQERGVKVRWVYDLDGKGGSYYSSTKNLAKILTNSSPDIISPQNKEAYSNSIMHNKFFIFDKTKVWIGSANISETDLSGFNANSVILISSSELANIYQKEFEQMYNGYFHKLKTQNTNPKVCLANSTISVFFSPQDKIIERQFLPLVRNARSYIYIPVFIVTHKGLTAELIAAKQRGVDVRILMDSTGALNPHAPTKLLRENGIKVKVEDRPGKMHMKSMIIDDRYTIIGSMNFSKSGEMGNDENVLIIENPQMAIAFKNNFNYLWSKIPDKWLVQIPRAESPDSINSCYDGIDNDHDGKIDMQDDSCNRRKIN